jgi:hypothetical protein
MGRSMTHNLRGPLRKLTPMISARALIQNSGKVPNLTKVPDEPGVYGWWFDCKIADAPLNDAPRLKKWRLVYVGIAPSSARITLRSRTLRDRIKNHCRGPSASSTLRRSLACLLATELRLRATNQGGWRLTMSRGAEDRLTTWIAQHAHVGWFTCRRPWDVEASILTSTTVLPLNIKGANHSFRTELKKCRAQFLRGEARVAERRKVAR